MSGRSLGDAVQGITRVERVGIHGDGQVLVGRTVRASATLEIGTL
jgi:hypothetical protein